ncbi:hypothetical protein RhiirB3_392589 [Rhizophagus irregularis]|nr:hypothetical protein RhiirB3_392589 [Rhizophagus irregularis]
MDCDVIKNANIGVIFENSPPVLYLQLKRLFANSGEAHEDMVSRETLSCDGVPQTPNELLTLRVVVIFKPKLKNHRPEPGFDLRIGCRSSRYPFERPFQIAMLETSIVLEAKKFFKVYWLANTVKKRKVIDIRLQKYTIISKHIEEISNKDEKLANSKICL